jgi:diaminopimelate epimerase
MKKLILTRISATENSFLFVDALSKTPTEISKSFGFDQIEDFVRNWTLGLNGILADGFVFVVKTEIGELNYKWDFYNCDGSSAEMCGNASRGMHLYISTYHNFKEPVLKFATRAGPITTKILEDKNIKVAMPSWKVIKESASFLVGENFVEFTLLNTGVPHIVVEVDDIKNESHNLLLAKTFRFNDYAEPNGANVTFYQRKLDHKISAISFERGVEGFTKSCGTGAVAAAIVFLLKKNKKTIEVKNTDIQIEVDVPGGKLSVIINFQAKTAFLIGEAHVDYEIHLDK